MCAEALSRMGLGVNRKAGSPVRLQLGKKGGDTISLVQNSMQQLCQILLFGFFSAPLDEGGEREPGTRDKLGALQEHMVVRRGSGDGEEEMDSEGRLKVKSGVWSDLGGVKKEVEGLQGGAGINQYEGS